MTTRLRNKLVDTINTLFGALGTTTDTRPSKRSKSNKAPYAWEFYVANHLHTLASARRKKAIESAIAAGVIFDHEKAPREPGPEQVIYEDDVVMVILAVNNPSSRVDPAKLTEFLQARGVSEQLLDDACEASRVTARPAHVFKAIIKTE